MTATLEQLVQVRSQLVEDLRGYYEALIDALDRTPWYRAGQLICASQVAIPARVLKEETKPPATPLGDDERLREPARIRVDPEIAALYEEPTLLKRREEVAWQQERRRVRRAVVIGAPGGGKSFLTETTAVQLAREALDQLRAQRTSLDDLPLPIHVELADLAQQGLPADPADALMELLRQQYRLSARLAAWVRAKLPTAPCWLILDSLDQVPERDRPRLNDRLKALETQGWQCRVVLTCRTANYDRALIPWSTLTEYELAPFRSQEIRRFTEQWFGEGNERGEALRRVLDSNFPLSHACRNPLIATLTCLAHEEGAVTEETRRGDLYARVLRGLARRAWQENPLNPNDPHIDDLLRLLEPVARTLFERRPESNQFTNAEIVEAIAAAPDRPLPRVLREQMEGGGLHPAVLAHAPTLLRDELHEGGILVGAGLSQSGELQFSFLHRTFLEYLTACALARQANSEGWPAIAGLVDKKAWLPAWQEAIVLLAGKLADPTPLLELLADEKKDDYFRHRLALASLCLPEIPQSRMTHQASLADYITTAAFSLYWERTMNEAIEAVLHLFDALPALGQVNARVKGTPLLEWLCRRLQDTDEDVRRRAAWTLGEMKVAVARHPEVLPALVAALRDAEINVHSQAKDLLGEMGEAAARHPEVLPTLMEYALRDAEINVRFQAAQALGKMGEAVARHPEVLPLLVDALRDAEKGVRYAALRALGEMGEVARHPEVLPALVAALRDADGIIRSLALEALREIGAAARHPEVLPAVVDALRDADRDVRVRAVWALSKMGKAVAGHPEVLSAFVEVVLEDADRYVRRDAVWTLGAAGQAAGRHPEVLTALMDALGDADSDVRSTVAKTLVEMAAAAVHPEVLSVLVQIARRDADRDVRHRVVWALGEAGQAAVLHPEVLPALIQIALRDTDRHVRERAAWALGEAGQAAGLHPEVLSVLVQIARRDADRDVRERAVWALSKMGGAAAGHPEVLPALVECALRDADSSVHYAAADLLGKMGAAAARHPGVLPALEDALHDARGSVRCRAAFALRDMGMVAQYPEMLPALVAALHDADYDVRWKAATELGAMGETATQHPAVLSALVECALRDTNPFVRLGAAWALRKMEAVARYPEVLLALVAALHDADNDVRRGAAEVLGEMGETAARHPEVLPALLAALDDAPWYVRPRAAWALHRLMAQGVRIFEAPNGEWEWQSATELAN